MRIIGDNTYRLKYFLVLVVLYSIGTGTVPAQAAAIESAAIITASTFRPESAVKDGITVEAIQKYTKALSADEMEGRGTMQPGGDRAANYIADQFKNLGLKPLGDKGSYLQSIDFKARSMTAKTSFEIGDTSLKHGSDYGIGSFSWGKESVSGDMVFVAYGIQAKSINRDDLAGTSISGKVVVLLSGPPANIPKKAWESQKADRLFIGNLIRQGAKALVFIGHGREEQPPSILLDYFSRTDISLASEPDRRNAPIPFIYASDEAAEKMFSASGTTRKDALAMAEKNDFKAIDLKQKAKIKIDYESEKGKSSNVVGVIEGSDPSLKSEAVLFSAHYDAYGVQNGKIYNGAADNALGTAEMLAVAEAFSKMDTKPKRSLIFLAVTGEEHGLYGSKYWAKNPTWDIKKVAANLNLDGIGSEVYGPLKVMVGFGAEHSTLGKMLDGVAKDFDVAVIDDPMPDEKIFLRSDHYSFVERGVPALMLMGGPEGTPESLVERIKAWEKIHYHQPSDDVMDDWVWEGARSVAQIMGVMGVKIADADSMPEWLPSSRFGKLKRGNTKDLPEEN